MREAILERSRRFLLSYCAMMNPQYEVPDHIFELAKILHEVEAGKTKRVIITMPPRHGKSMLDSQYFPAWFLGRNPDKFIITATYGQDLASDFGRKVRDQVKDPLFTHTFPKCVMRDDTSAAHRFSTTAGGEYYAVGAGGPITGRGAHLLLIDDPLKGRDEADSEKVRNGVNEWYGAVAYTRLMPDASIIILMTRWHEEDLVGYVLSHTNEHWEVIDFPAILDEGTPQEEALWPERYPLEVLKTIRATLPEYDWYCLYQQNPIPKGGIVFKAEWLKEGHPEEYAAIYAGMDLAISEKESACETSITVFGLDYSNPWKAYEIETIHGHWDFPEQVRQMRAIFDKGRYSKPVDLMGVESVYYQKALAQTGAAMGLPIIPLDHDTDKYRLAMTVTPFFSQGRVYINSPHLRKQVLSFRGVKGEKNDLAESMVQCLRLIRDHTSEHIVKVENKYKGLDPRSEMFWRNHFDDLPGKTRPGDHLFNSL